MEYPVARLDRLRRTDRIRAAFQESAPRLASTILVGSAETLPREAARRHLGGCFLELGPRGAKAAVQAVRAARRSWSDGLLAVPLGSRDPASGHDGVVVDGVLDEDETLELLQRQAVSFIEAGADLVLVRGLIEGAVGAVRDALEEADLGRWLVGSLLEVFSVLEPAPRARRFDPGAGRQVVRRAEIDVSEGADLVVLSPGLRTLDLLRDLREELDVPLGAMALGARDLADAEEMAVIVTRAGADVVFTDGPERTG